VIVPPKTSSIVSGVHSVGLAMTAFFSLLANTIIEFDTMSRPELTHQRVQVRHQGN